MKTKIYEMPVYCGRLKVWRVLNISSGTVYSGEHRTEEKAFKSIEHGTERAGFTVKALRVLDLARHLENQDL